MIGINEIASTVIQIVHRRINKIIEIHMYMNKNINYSTGPKPLRLLVMNQWGCRRHNL